MCVCVCVCVCVFGHGLRTQHKDPSQLSVIQFYATALWGVQANTSLSILGCCWHARGLHVTDRQKNSKRMQRTHFCIVGLYNGLNLLL